MTAPDEAPGDTSDAVPSDGLLTFHLNGLPIAVHARAQEHADGVTRELILAAASLRQGSNARDLPAGLVDLINALSAQESMLTGEQENQIAAAIAADHDTINLTYRLPAAAADAAQKWGDILDAADDYCRAGGVLLTLATPADLVAYRRWFHSQFADQAAGQSPVSWDAHLRQHPT